LPTLTLALAIAPLLLAPSLMKSETPDAIATAIFLAKLLRLRTPQLLFVDAFAPIPLAILVTP